jgi:peptidoglycan/LPS O-acetylase OafA/YrhL
MGLLRLILAISVVLAHSGTILGTRFIGGPTAVQAFYIISGFYMALILNEKYIGNNSSYKLFITNRLLRIYPTYWIILVSSILFSITVYFYNHGNKAGLIQPYVDYFSMMNIWSIGFLILSNLILFFQDTVLFLGINLVTGNLYFTDHFSATNPLLYKFMLVPQAWTISLELIFYLIAPFLARKTLKIIVFLIALSILLRIVLTHYGLKEDPWSYRFFPTELVFFLLGLVSYRIYVKLRIIKIHDNYLKMIWGVIIVFTIFFDFITLPEKTYLYLFIFFLCLPFVFLLTNKWKQDLYLGDLSYPIYLSHILVLACIHGLKIPMVGGPGLSLSIWTIVSAILLNEFVVKKIERIRQNRIKPAP